MSFRRLLTLVLLVAWALLGPVGMAFDTCAGAMALCDGGPCGAVAAVTVIHAGFGPAETVTAIPLPLPDVRSSVLVTALDPPPKSLRPLG